MSGESHGGTAARLDDLYTFIQEEVPEIVRATKRGPEIEVIHSEIGAPFSLELWVEGEYPQAQVTQIGGKFAGCTRWVVSLEGDNVK